MGWSVAFPYNLMIYIPVNLAIFVMALFALAGRWDWWAGWGFLVIVTITAGWQIWRLARSDPELFRRRSELGKGTAAFDIPFFVVFTAGFLALFIVAPLDAVRFGWAPLPAPAFFAGAILFVMGQTLVGRAMNANTHFEKTVRLQTDRNHKVMTGGPYAIIRHPGYTGLVIGYAMGFPLMLTSAWAFLPAVLVVISVVYRTVLEDRFLNEKLDGYPQYAARVKFKLVPGIW